MDAGGLVNIHSIIPVSRVNGPGARMVVFFQGCSRGCAGCFNPATHAFGAGELVRVDEIFDAHACGAVEGVTLSGGEPFDQPAALLEVLGRARALKLSTVVYTGFELVELEHDPVRAPSLELVDVLVAGAYEEGLAEPTRLARGSTNQILHFLTERYSLDDFYMPGRVEVVISEDGIVTGTGFSRVPVQRVL